MYISNKIILLLLIITTLIVSINLIIKNIKTKEYYADTEPDPMIAPYSILNKVMKDFNNVYEKKIRSSIGLINFQRDYY